MAVVEEDRVEEAEYKSASEEEAVLHWTMRRGQASDEDEDSKGEEERERRRESDTLGGAPEDSAEVSYIDELGEELEEEVERDEQDGEGEVSEVAPGKYHMHCDRYRDSYRGQRRSTPAGRNLWKLEDEMQWKHDKFEQTTLLEAQNEKGRWIPKGPHQGYIKDQHKGCKYIKANQSRHHNNFVNQDESVTVRGRGPVRYKPDMKSNNVRIVRGRGPVRYKPDMKSNNVRIVRGRGPVRYRPVLKSNDEVTPTKCERSGKSVGSALNTNSSKILSHTSNIQSDSLAAKKHISASCSASPQFDAVSSSRHEKSGKQKTHVQGGRTNIYHVTSDQLKDNKQIKTFLQGKTQAVSVDLDGLCIEDSTQPVAVNYLTNLPLWSPTDHPGYSAGSPQMKGQRRGLSLLKKNSHQSNPSSTQVKRVHRPGQPSVARQRPTECIFQPPIRHYTQQLRWCPRIGSQASSTHLSLDSSEALNLDPLPKSGKSRVALVGKDSGAVQPSGRVSFQYDETLGSQNIAATPAPLSVVQLGGLHHGSLADPATGMTFTGCVGQSQVGIGNSEMTRLPVSTGVAGTLGTAYRAPYVTLNDSYRAHSLGQLSAVGVSRNIAGTVKPSSGNRPQDRRELFSKEYCPRQSKPRRYSQMNFNEEVDR